MPKSYALSRPRIPLNEDQPFCALLKSTSERPLTPEAAGAKERNQRSSISLCLDLSLQISKFLIAPSLAYVAIYDFTAKRLTENELSDFRRLWHDGCGKTIIEAQDVDRNHSPEV
jgi:hypothetical protein